MNMKIKIKNKDNKLFVALVLIAALMMVSVAGVVMSDEAKGLETSMVGAKGAGNFSAASHINDGALNLELSPSVVATLDSTPVFFSATYTYIVTDAIKYSGTISVGTELNNVFIAQNTVKFTDASSVVISVSAKWMADGTKITDFDASSITVTTYNKSAVVSEKTNTTTGTIEVTKGEALFGKDIVAPGAGPVTTNYFTGTVNGTEMVNVLNLQITNTNNSIGLSGNNVTGGNQAKSPIPADADAGEKQPTLTVDSKITVTSNVTIGNLKLGGSISQTSTSIGTPTISDVVELVINEGVTATVAPTTNTEYGVVIDTQYAGGLASGDVTLSNATGGVDLTKVSKNIYTNPFTGFKSVMLSNFVTTAGVAIAVDATFNIAIELGDSTYKGLASYTDADSKWIVTGFGTNVAFTEYGIEASSDGIAPTATNPIGYKIDAASGAVELRYYLTGAAAPYTAAYAIKLSDMATPAQVIGIAGVPTDFVKGYGTLSFTSFTETDTVVIALQKGAVDGDATATYDYFVGDVIIANSKITGITPILSDNLGDVIAVAPVDNDAVTAEVGTVQSTKTAPNANLHVAQTEGLKSIGFNITAKSVTAGAEIQPIIAAEGVITGIVAKVADSTANQNILMVQEDADGKIYVGIVEGAVVNPTADGTTIALVAADTADKTKKEPSTYYSVLLTSKVEAIKTVTVTKNDVAYVPIPVFTLTDEISYGGLESGTYELTVTGTGVSANDNSYVLNITIAADGTMTAVTESEVFRSAFATTAIVAVAKTEGSTLEIVINNKMTVNGSVIATAKDCKVLSTGTVDVEGMVTVKDTISEINAAMYTVTADGISVYYYTTLSKAMTSASTIIVYGDIVIKEDLEFTGNSTADTKSNNITIDGGAIVEVGVAADPDDDTIVPVTVTVTVPTTTNLLTSGKIDVKNGQFKWTYLTAPGVIDNVESDVFIVEDTTGVYTDLTTALSLAKDGSIVKLRDGVTMSEITSAATVAKGVTLEAANIPIGIKAGGKLTIDGKLTMASANQGIGIEAAGDGKSAGELIINSKDVTISAIYLEGILTIGTDVELTEDAVIGISAETESIPAVINVNGTFNNKGAIIATALSENYVTINVSGKYVNSFVNADANVYSKVFVTGEFNAALDVTVDELTVTGSGKAIVTSNAIITVNVSVYSGDAANTADNMASSSTNNTEMKVTLKSTPIDDTAYAVIYGKPADGKVVISNTGTVKTEVDLGAGELYATLYATAAGRIDIIEIKDPAITGFVFNGFYTSPDFAEGSKVVADKHIGDSGYTKVYAKMDIRTYTISFKYDAGIKWLLDGVAVEGNQKDIAYGPHSVSFTFMDGYSGDVKLTMNGSSYKSGDNFTLDENGNEFNSSGAHKTIPGDQMDMIEILLIVITIVFVIVAIVVIMRLMRS